LHLVVADPPAVQSLLERIVPVLRPTQLVVQSSTIDPQSAERFCGMVRATGARYVEAPFTGSKPAAESRTLVYYLGGRAEDLDLAEPYLAHLSRKRLRLPEPRQAAALKLSMNLQIAMVTQSIVEGLSFARHAGLADETRHANPLADPRLLQAAEQTLNGLQPAVLLVTLGELGMLLCQRGQPPFHIPTVAQEVFDVSGAGDTVIATFTLAIASGASPVEAAILANHAAGIVVGKVGTATVSPEELLASFANR
jgi:hypothetical protein